MSTTGTTRFVPASRRILSEITVIEIIVAVVISLVLAEFWQRFFKNLIYHTFCVDKYSTYQLFVVALSMTIAFVILLNVIQSLAADVVLGTPLPAQVSTQGVNIGVRDRNTGSMIAESCDDNECRCG